MCLENHRNRAFTLLELILAVAMVGIVTMTIARFVESNLRAVQISNELGEQDQQVETVFAVLASELLNLAPRQNEALLGEPHKFGEYSSDELSWVCGPGNGLFTSHASGEYRVTLKIGKAGELGISRRPLETKSHEASWVSLLNDVVELRINYFDLRLNAWIDKWTDGSARPALVRMELLRRGDDVRYERLLRVAKEARADK